MAYVNTKVVFQCDINTIWNTMTSLDNYAWRTDIAKIEVKSETEFTEITHDGYVTKFTTTMIEPFKRWEFDIDNENISGHWIGILTQKNDCVELDLTEDVAAKKTIMRPFVKAYLKKQQAQYVADLKSALSQ